MFRSLQRVSGQVRRVMEHARNVILSQMLDRDYRSSTANLTGVRCRRLHVGYRAPTFSTMPAMLGYRSVANTPDS